MIVSGGFNIYPDYLEQALREHPDLEETAVAGVPSGPWGETPVAFAVVRSGSRLDAEQLLDRANERLGKIQRLAAVQWSTACLEA